MNQTEKFNARWQKTRRINEEVKGQRQTSKEAQTDQPSEGNTNGQHRPPNREDTRDRMDRRGKRKMGWRSRKRYNQTHEKEKNMSEDIEKDENVGTPAAQTAETPAVENVGTPVAESAAENVGTSGEEDQNSESQRQEAQRQEAQRQDAQRQEAQRQEAQRQEAQRQEERRPVGQRPVLEVQSPTGQRPTLEVATEQESSNEIDWIKEKREFWEKYSQEIGYKFENDPEKDTESKTFSCGLTKDDKVGKIQYTAPDKVNVSKDSPLEMYQGVVKDAVKNGLSITFGNSLDEKQKAFLLAACLMNSEKYSDGKPLEVANSPKIDMNAEYIKELPEEAQKKLKEYCDKQDQIEAAKNRIRQHQGQEAGTPSSAAQNQGQEAGTPSPAAQNQGQEAGTPSPAAQNQGQGKRSQDRLAELSGRGPKNNGQPGNGQPAKGQPGKGQPRIPQQKGNEGR